MSPAAIEERRIRWLLGALLTVAALLRLWQAAAVPPYFDEVWSFYNVTPILKHGSLVPRHALYLSLSYLPQAALMALASALHQVTDVPWLEIKRVGGYTGTAYFLGRLGPATYGVLTLLVVYRIGRRLASPRVGLLAAALLAAFPRHLRSSGQFKPDMLVLLLVAVTFLWTLDAAEAPPGTERRRYLRAGLGSGLALAAKFTGAAAALPVAALALWRARSDRRHLLWLTLAGCAALAAFLALNPFVSLLVRDFLRLRQGYGAAGDAEDSDHGVVAVREALFLLDGHGWLGTAFLALGTALALVRLARPREAREHDQALLLLTGFLGYSALHAAGMTLFRGQNYLPVLPFTSLLASIGAFAAWDWTRRRIASREAPLAHLTTPIGATLALLGGLALLWQPAAQTYRASVPTQLELAEDFLARELRPLGTRQVVVERAERNLQLEGEGARATVRNVARLDQVAPEQLDLSDAEVFAGARLQGSERSAYRERLARLESRQVRRFIARPFRARGPELVVLLHPWQIERSWPLALAAAADGRPRAQLPAEIQAGDVLSVAVTLPRGGVRAGKLEALLGALALPLRRSGREDDRPRLASGRAVLVGSAERPALVLTVPERLPLATLEVELLRWRPAHP